MRNFKLEKNLTGDSYWPNISFVSVKGISGQESAAGIEDSSEREKIIQTWNNIAVMKATSEKPTEFFLGFFKDKKCQYLKHEFTTDMEFGMRIGSEDVNFFVFPKDLNTPIKLEIIEQTKENDPKYSDLILI